MEAAGGVKSEETLEARICKLGFSFLIAIIIIGGEVEDAHEA